MPELREPPIAPLWLALPEVPDALLDPLLWEPLP